MYVSTLRSARSIRKVAKLLVGLSYTTIILLFFVVFQLEGYHKGPKKALQMGENLVLFSYEIWAVASIQVLLELGICHGVPLVYGCYSGNQKTPVHIDSFFICTANYLTSLLCFFLVFSYLGAISCGDKYPWELLNHGLGALYLIGGESFLTISGGSLWSVLFFFMLWMAVLGTQIALFEVIVDGFLYDYFNNLSKFRWFLNLIICSSFFLGGLVFCSSNGFFIVNLLHTMITCFVVLPLTLFFSFSIIYLYGAKRVLKNVGGFVNISPRSVIRPYLHLMVVFLAILFLLSLYSIKPQSVSGYEYQGNGVYWGWVIFILILVPVGVWGVLWVLYSVVKFYTCEHVLKSSKEWDETEMGDSKSEDTSRNEENQIS